jgi:hypothetical protein
MYKECKAPSHQKRYRRYNLSLHGTALHGLSYSVDFPQLTFLTLVLFNGYEVFTRHNPLWGFVNTSWGFYVSSWVELGILIVALLGWLVHGYISSGKWGLRIPDPQNAEIVDGRAEDLDDIIPSQRNRFKRTVLWILNNI